MYGIIWKHADGKLQYCRNTNTMSIKHPDYSWSDDPTNFAVLAQEKTAVAVVKKLHGIGFEEQMGGEVYVVALSYSISEPIKVPKKAEKHGYAICDPHGRYYTGNLSEQRHYSSSSFEGDKFTCTVFKTKEAAQSKIEEIFVVLDGQVQAEQEENSRYKTRTSQYYHLLRERVRHLQVIMK